MAVYTCKYCGQQSAAPSLAGGGCHKSPTKKHVLCGFTEKQAKYVCKYCGQQSSSPTLAIGGCQKSPHKSHELLG